MSAFELHYFLEGWQSWKKLPLETGTLTIGRLPANQLHIDDPRLSRFHAHLRSDGQQVWIEDLGASNGVLIGGARIPAHVETRLPVGENVTLGPLVLRVVQTAPVVQPPGKTAPPIQPRPAAVVSPARNQPAALAAKAPVNWLLIAGGGLLIVCLCVVVIGGGGWLLYPRLAAMMAGDPDAGIALPFLATPTPAVYIAEPPVIEASHTLSAAQGQFSDEFGANLSISGDVLPAEENLTVEQSRLSESMQQELEQSLTVESLAYSITADVMDGAGRAQLSLPAPSPDSRLAMLLDDEFLAVLPIEPQNGQLNLDLFLGAPSAADGYHTEATAALPNRYFVVTPKAQSDADPGGVYLTGHSAQEELVRCTPLIWRGNRCWTNKAGSVMVLYWNTEVPENLQGDEPDQPPPAVGAIISSVVQVMSKYQQAGLTNAAISSSRPVYVIVSKDQGEPTYSQKTGNIYLGWAAAGEVTSNVCTLSHELMHWIEDEVYAMNGAALLNYRAWWLEMAAENGSFLIDNSCLGHVLSTYGYAEVGNQLAWQSNPFHWDWGEGARYIQSLQMYISICDGGGRCAISSDEFVSLINSAGYPSSSAQDAYLSNADDMGRYLLGYAPLLARSNAVIIPGLTSGSGYGDYIWMKNVGGPVIDFSLNNGRITQANPREVEVNTTIAEGGVYPLWVSNGKGSPAGGAAGYTSLPGLLTIAPGTPLWYSLDNGAPVFHAGGEELVLGALSDKLGVGLVRIIGTAPDGDAQFQAAVEPVDLSGDWVNEITSSTSTLLDCGDLEEDFEVADFVTYFSSAGTYVLDSSVADGSHYIWEGSAADLEEANGTLVSEITVTPDKVTLTYRIDIPRPETGYLLPPAIMAALPIQPQASLDKPVAAGLTGMDVSPMAWVVFAGVGLLALALLAARLHRLEHALVYRLGRIVPAALLTLLMGSMLSGCINALAIWGTIEGNYTYTRLTYAEGNPLAGELADAGVEWMLDGSGTIDYALRILVEFENEDGTTEVQEEACNLQFNANLQGMVGPADMVSAPEE